MDVDTAANLLIAGLLLLVGAFAALLVAGLAGLGRFLEDTRAAVPSPTVAWQVAVRPSDRLLTHKLFDHPGRAH